jgi:hypothetical protein
MCNVIKAPVWNHTRSGLTLLSLSLSLSFSPRDVYYNPATRGFRKKPPPGGAERTFVQFILEPLYKIYTQALGEHQKSIEKVLAEFGVFLKPAMYQMDVKPLIKVSGVLRPVPGSRFSVSEMLVCRQLGRVRARN